MHGYLKQVSIRWASFAIALVVAAAWLGLCAYKSPSLLTEAGIKSLLIEMSVAAEYAPFWVWFIVFFAITAALYVGVPSVMCFALLFAYTNPWVAFFVIFLCQIFVSRLAIKRAFKRVLLPDFQAKLDSDLKNKLFENQKHALSFAFWARLYISYPLRTIDELTPLISPDKKALTKTLAAASPAIFIRTLITSLWAFSFASIITISNSLQGSVNFFLTMSSVIVVYAVLPKIPELFICPPKIKNILYIIDKTQTDIVESPAFAAHSAFGV